MEERFEWMQETVWGYKQEAVGVQDAMKETISKFDSRTAEVLSIVQASESKMNEWVDFGNV